MHENDEQIYKRFLRERDDRDLCLLLERHRESLFLFLLGLVHNAEDAEELMMDAFAVAASGTAGFAGRSSFKTWLFSIGKKMALMRLRDRRTIPNADGETPLSAFFLISWKIRKIIAKKIKNACRKAAYCAIMNKNKQE